jgi:hypothetical protein
MSKESHKKSKPNYSVDNIREGLTLSGINTWDIKVFHESWLGGFEEYFNTVPWMHFKLKDGLKEDYDRAQQCVDFMSQFEDIGDFAIVNQEQQMDEHAAFAWIVFDRATRHAQAGKSGWDAMKYAFELWECMHIVDPDFKSLRRTAKKGIAKKLANDPKQKEKKFVRECWDKWQASPSNYLSQAEFARDMLSKSEHLTSQKKIEDWCRVWKTQKKSPY